LTGSHERRHEPRICNDANYGAHGCSLYHIVGRFCHVKTSVTAGCPYAACATQRTSLDPNPGFSSGPHSKIRANITKNPILRKVVLDLVGTLREVCRSPLPF
jgi:hypothetical protein